jgi:hypothetical protein
MFLSLNPLYFGSLIQTARFEKPFVGNRLPAWLTGFQDVRKLVYA